MELKENRKRKKIEKLKPLYPFIEQSNKKFVDGYKEEMKKEFLSKIKNIFKDL